MKKNSNHKFCVHKNPRVESKPLAHVRPDIDTVLVVRLSSALLMDALGAYTHCTLGTDQPIETKSWTHTSRQLF